MDISRSHEVAEPDPEADDQPELFDDGADVERVLATLYGDDDLIDGGDRSPPVTGERNGRAHRAGAMP